MSKVAGIVQVLSKLLKNYDYASSSWLSLYAMFRQTWIS